MNIKKNYTCMKRFIDDLGITCDEIEDMLKTLSVDCLNKMQYITWIIIFFCLF